MDLKVPREFGGELGGSGSKVVGFRRSEVRVIRGVGEEWVGRWRCFPC